MLMRTEGFRTVLYPSVMCFAIALGSGHAYLLCCPVGRVGSDYDTCPGIKYQFAILLRKRCHIASWPQTLQETEKSRVSSGKFAPCASLASYVWLVYVTAVLVFVEFRLLREFRDHTFKSRQRPVEGVRYSTRT